MKMSIFPTGAAMSGRRIAGRDPGLETDGVLVRPISGQIYLIEEGDLEGLLDGETQSPLSGLVSRH
jgi:hypothetical protein